MYPISRSIPLFLIFLCCLAAAHAQTAAASNSAPINWTDYRVSSQRLSIQFPKLPTMQSLSNQCTQVVGASYYAYADGVGYEFAWRAQSGEPIPKWCDKEDKKEKFSEKMFTDRIGFLEKQGLVAQQDTNIAGIPAKVLRTTSGMLQTRWLIWAKDRWFELGISSQGGKVVDESKFIAGLSLKSSIGQEIGDGADAVLGDPDNALTTASSGISAPLRVLTKPKARFTDAARQGDFSGTVMLRVVFEKNGAIGDISVIKDAPYGLPDEAIKAAKKMGFLPPLVNGTPVRVTKSVEYSFTLY